MQVIGDSEIGHIESSTIVPRTGSYLSRPATPATTPAASSASKPSPNSPPQPFEPPAVRTADVSASASPLTAAGNYSRYPEEPTGPGEEAYGQQVRAPLCVFQVYKVAQFEWPMLHSDITHTEAASGGGGSGGGRLGETGRNGTGWDGTGRNGTERCGTPRDGTGRGGRTGG
uniref:Uncharacterized protein n=1 Tax=Vespula pensylvanica TaxID=30213 RepID=A0A834NRF1_VESPE|nr:hypothetical protein H0235_011140 [Vespula pensylvanica]